MAQDDIHARPVPPAHNPPGSPPQQIIIQQPPSAFGRFGKWLLAALVISVMVIIALYINYQSYFTPEDMPQEKYHSLEKFATQKIAIIDISGAITEEEDGFIKKQIDRVREDQEVVAIVARINSPGGTVTGSDYIYHHLRELVEDRNLPLVVSMGSVCASGGYYAAMAVGNQPDTIFAEPTSWTGSIGVIIPHFDMSGTLTKLGIKEDSIASGALKKMGTPTRPMTEQERQLLQELVDDSFGRFKEVVMSGRPKFKDDPAAFDEVATGQIFTANQALDQGLVDKIGFVEEAIERAVELAKVDPQEVRCVKYEERPTFFGEMMGASAALPARGGVDLAAVMELMTPRAYYLWTWLPAAMTNTR